MTMRMKLAGKRSLLRPFCMLLVSLLSTFTYAGPVKQAWTELVGEKFNKRAEFAFVDNDPKLANVLLYGDSISIHYTNTVRERLTDKANVYRIHLNGGDSSSFIAKMTKMLATMQSASLVEGWSFNWDVIHFNVGLHDLKYLKQRKLDKANGKQVTSIEQYETNLSNIVIYLKKIAPKARLIFATTTPIPEGEPGRLVGDAQKYNRSALKVLKAFPEVIINDLYAFTKPNHKNWWQEAGNVHYNDIGRKAQGNQVAQHILSQLTNKLKNRHVNEPDSEGIRNRLAVKFAASSTSPFDLLVELGRDCVGAVQLLKPDEKPTGIHQISAKPVNEAEIAEVLRNTVLSTGLLNKDNDDFRISLAGAQEKTAFLWHDGQWCVPLGATPTTHIFKLPLGLAGNISADINSVENEWLCSKILAGFGIPIAHCDLGEFEDQKVLIVERFDRVYSQDNSWIIRLPQEDFCQTNAISPLQKYQSDGGLSISDIMKILNGSSEPLRDKHTFFAVQVIFWLLFAIDGHAKNFSVKHTSRNTYEMTPIYDVLSIFPILGPKQDQIATRKAKLAMAIRSSKNYDEIDRIMKRHFIAQAVSVGITKQQAIQLMDAIVEATPAVIEHVYGLLPEGFNKSLADSILQGMGEQAVKLAKMPTQML